MKRKERSARDRARADVAVAMAAGAMYIAAVGFGMSYARVAAALGRDRSTVQHACRVVEDRRDDPAFDMWIDALEVTASRAPVMS